MCKFKVENESEHNHGHNFKDHIRFFPWEKFVLQYLYYILGSVQVLYITLGGWGSEGNAYFAYVRDQHSENGFKSVNYHLTLWS